MMKVAVFRVRQKLEGITVGGLEHGLYDFPYIGNVIIPTDELHHFSEGIPPTSIESQGNHCCFCF